MKEIKFRRPWFKPDGSFSHFSEWGIGINQTQFTAPSQANFAKPGEDQQYIGIKDMRGKPIYEGDILRGHFMDGLGKTGKASLRYFTIQFYQHSCESGFWIVTHADTRQKYRFFPALNRCEIVGNIHETPQYIESFNKDYAFTKMIK